MFAQSTSFFLLSLLVAITSVSAQTSTLCNPMNGTCPGDLALGTSHTWNFTHATTADTTIWNTTAGTINYELDGAEFTINGKGESPTMQSNFYIFFGQVSVVMKAATGQGIVSSIVLESDDLDEVDWEWIGGNKTHVQTNFFGKGNTTSYDRAIWYEVNDPQDAYHNYTTTWTAEKLEWFVDGNLIRTLHYNDSVAVYGKNYPQTPMNVRLGIWAGGDPDSNSNGTVEWAGGDVDYDKAPFTMTVQSVYVEDYSSGKLYTYGDTSGDWESIKVAAGNSTIAEKLNTNTSIGAKFSSMSKAAQIAVVCVVAGVGAASLGLLTFCCIKSRRAGRRERAIADAEWEKNVAELNAWKRKGARGTEEEVQPMRSGFY